jgi:hypothetical protein
MTVQLGDTGKVAYGTLKTFNIALATPRETLLGTPVALPATEPISGQFSFTVQAADLPTITPSPISTKYTALVYAGGKNADAAAQNVNWRVLKNGVSVATGTHTGVPASQFWTHGYFQYMDVVVGDVLEIRLWSPSANVNYDYYSIAISMTRVQLGNAQINKDVLYGTGVFSSLVSGTPSAQLTHTCTVFPSDVNTVGVGLSNNHNFGALKWNATYQAFRTELGDNTITTQTFASTTNRPVYRRNAIPGTISFREVLR